MSSSASLGPLWRWWVAELAAMLPAGLRRRLFAPAPIIIAEPQPDGGFRFARVEAARATPIGTDPVAAGLPVWLALPPSAVLECALDWPEMPVADLRQAARLDLDRLTPLPAAALWFDVAIRGWDRGARRLEVRLAVARAAEIEALTTALATGHGIVPAGVAAGEGLAFRLAPALAAPGPAARRRFGLPASRRDRLVLACLVLGALNLGLWWQSDAARREALATELATARNRARAVEALRTQLAAREALRTEVLGDRTGGSLLRLLDELTRLVPDGAWLDSVEVRGGSVYVTGYAPAAAALIGLIERSPVFAEAQFRAPVVPDRTNGLERFDMSISLRGRS